MAIFHIVNELLIRPTSRRNELKLKFDQRIECELSDAETMRNTKVACTQSIFSLLFSIDM